MTGNDVGVFRRGQVEHALWHLFTRSRSSLVSPVFRTRIKRLLELDRLEMRDEDGNDIPSAFIDGTVEGTGIDLHYTSFNAFLLAVGLDLLDAGFKQSEIVFLLRHIRATLEQEYRKMLTALPTPRQLMSPRDRPGCPTRQEGRIRVADCRVYMVIQKVDLTEVYAKPPDDPIIFQPVFCHGIEELGRELNKLNYDRRKALVLELGETAAVLLEALAAAPLVKRGRK